MEDQLLRINSSYKFEGLDRFRDLLSSRKCIYYASDLLVIGNENFEGVETTVLHTLEVFKTLDIPPHDHFYKVYSCSPDRQVYKDWKVSELAVLYMVMNGDPTDLKTIALQQTSLIDGMLQHLSTYSKMQYR